jgi:hypothetical protein
MQRRFPDYGNNNDVHTYPLEGAPKGKPANNSYVDFCTIAVEKSSGRGVKKSRTYCNNFFS